MESSPSLRRQLGVASSTALVVGATIGVGIFLTPGSMAKAAGAPGVLFAVWIVLGLMALAGALCIGELASRFPHAGGSYVYLREAFGPKLAFLYGGSASSSWTRGSLRPSPAVSDFTVGPVAWA